MNFEDISAKSLGTDRGDPGNVRGLARGLRILTEFSTREPFLGTAELSRRLQIPRTSTLRLLYTLESLGFLQRGKSDRCYALGSASLRLGFEYLQSLDVTEVGLPIIEALCDKTGKTADIVIRDRCDVVFVAQALSQTIGLRSMKVHVGTRLPAYATAHGHSLLSDHSLERLRALFEDQSFVCYSQNTAGSVDELYQRVYECVRRGYALNRSSSDEGVQIIAAPVRSDNGSIVAAIALTVPLKHEDASARDKDLELEVCRAAEELSFRLSTRPVAKRANPQYPETVGL